MTERIELNGAVLERTRPDVLEVRFKAGVPVSNELIAELQKARLDHFGANAHHLVLIIPEDFDFNVRVMNNDHCAEGGLARITTSVVWVTNTHLARSLVDLYYAYFPSPAQVRMFDSEADARTWLLTEVHMPSAN